jgi:hypothetical protein
MCKNKKTRNWIFSNNSGMYNVEKFLAIFPETELDHNYIMNCFEIGEKDTHSYAITFKMNHSLNVWEIFIGDNKTCDLIESSTLDFRQIMV